MHLLEGPDIVLEHILSYLSYDEIAKMRMVCKAFNAAGQRLLNRGFLNMERKHNAILKSVKARLPRRESERRSHPLARHCDILTSIETRISMLSMTYSKYIDQNMCCFIPGKVIDEILRLLRVLEECDSPPRAHEILQELRDISSMAIEHFDEKISPDFKQKRHTCTMTNAMSTAENSIVLNYQSNLSQGSLRQALNKVVINKVVNDTFHKRFTNLSNECKKMQSMVVLQQKRLRQQRLKIRNQDIQISELKRRMDDWEARHNEITANVSQINNYEPKPTIRGTLRTSQVLETVAPVLSQMIDNVVAPNIILKKNNIKPRMAQITLKRSSSDSSDKEEPKKTKYSTSSC